MSAASVPTFSREIAIDLGRARCVGYVAERLRRVGFEVATEVEVGEGRWRGWIDILAFHRVTGLMLVVEVKTELHDVGAEQRRFATYEREAWAAARRSGWLPSRRASALVLLRTESIDRVVTTNRSVLEASFPSRSCDLLRWLTDPASAPQNARAIAAIDPRSRRRDWLFDAGTDGRRRPARYRDYGDLVRRPGRVTGQGHAVSA